MTQQEMEKFRTMYPDYRKWTDEELARIPENSLCLSQVRLCLAVGLAMEELNMALRARFLPAMGRLSDALERRKTGI